MDVDLPVYPIEEPSIPTDAQAPPSPAKCRAVRCTGQLRQCEVTVEPTCMQLTKTQSNGPQPMVMQLVGIQAEYGRETLQKRWKRVLMTREHLAEKKRLGTQIRNSSSQSSEETRFLSARFFFREKFPLSGPKGLKQLGPSKRLVKEQRRSIIPCTRLTDSGKKIMKHAFFCLDS